MPHQFNRDLFNQFVRFAAVGLSGTLIQYLTLWIAHGYYDAISAQTASAI